MFNSFDRQRLENSIWTLFKYRDDIVNSSDEMKLDQYEVEAMFKTLSYVEGLVTREELSDIHIKTEVNNENRKCPFCGGTVPECIQWYDHSDHRYYYYIRCSICKSGTHKYYLDKDTAWAAWNHRV